MSDEFLIPSAAGSGGLLFFNRSPADRSKPFENFWVRVTDHNLSAAAQVYAGYLASDPAQLFADMAGHWSGWKDEFAWESLEYEMAMRCRRDGLGHVSIQVTLCSGLMPDDWKVRATVMTEAGQLETLARRAGLFFGRAE